MNKNQMRRKRRRSWLVTAKSISIKSAKRIFGGCAPKVNELTSGDLPFVAERRLRKAEAILNRRQKSAESIVVWRKANEGSNG